MLLGCIADDVTGATDLAALLARSGLPVVLHLGLPEGSAPEARLQVIALKIRTVPVHDAVAQALAALRWLRTNGAQRFYWKYCSTFDSTPAGNIGPVAEALMAELNLDQTIYCPAFPENGRTIFMGNLFVGEQPLGESPMRDHPLTPMRDSNLMRLLAPQVQGRTGLANRLVVARGAGALTARLQALRAEGVAHVVVDAVADADLGIIAEAVANCGLVTGGSALAMALPGAWQALDGRAEPMPLPVLPMGSIVLSGSCSAMTRAQVEAYLPQAASLRLDPVDLAQNGPGAAQAWLAAQPVEAAKMIHATASPGEVARAQAILGVAKAGHVVEQALAALALQAHGMGTRRFVVAGGETAGAVVQALGLRQLTIGPEIAPGVPWTFRDGADPVALALKSGNFGGPGFFVEALAKLEKT